MQIIAYSGLHKKNHRRGGVRATKKNLDTPLRCVDTKCIQIMFLIDNQCSGLGPIDSHAKRSNTTYITVVFVLVCA